MPPSFDRLGGFPGDALVGFPAAAGDADRADALAAGHDRAAAFHRRPALRACGKREAERVRHVERLADRALRSRASAVGSGANRLGGGRVHGVEAAAFHALEEHEVPAGIDDGHAHGHVRFPGARDGRVHDLARARGGQALRIRDVHASSSSPVYITQMPLSHIEHFLVAADDIDATRDWYARVLGMKSGPHPDFGFPVHWMYLGEVDIVHIGPSAKGANEIQKKFLGRTSQDSGTGTGALDHIAFRATGLKQMLQHLRSEGIAFSQRRANGQALFQLFLYDPNGVKIELNYAAAEAEGIAPELMASDLIKAAQT